MYEHSVMIAAKHSGKCATCCQPAKKGDVVIWYPDRNSVVHTHCDAPPWDAHYFARIPFPANWKPKTRRSPPPVVTTCARRLCGGDIRSGEWVFLVGGTFTYHVSCAFDLANPDDWTEDSEHLMAPILKRRHRAA